MSKTYSLGIDNNPLKDNALFKPQSKEKIFTPEEEEKIKEAERQMGIKRGRPKKDTLIREGVQAGLSEELTRATFILSVDLLNDVKNYAYTERLSIKKAVDKLLRESLEAYKKNGGKLLDRKGNNS